MEGSPLFTIDAVRENVDRARELLSTDRASVHSDGQHVGSHTIWQIVSRYLAFV